MVLAVGRSGGEAKKLGEEKEDDGMATRRGWFVPIYSA